MRRRGKRRTASGRYGWDSVSLAFQNCIRRLRRFVLLALCFFPGSFSYEISIDSLLRSPCELLIRRLRLARLDRRLPNAAEETEAGRSARNETGRMLAPLGRYVLSLVIVELLEVREGISSTDIRTSGPGWPRRRDWKLVSSLTDEGAVEIR